MKNNINYLKKQIIYKCSYSGTKETDILYRKLFIKRINDFSKDELNLILELFNEFSDHEIFNILTKKTITKNKYSEILEKLF